MIVRSEISAQPLDVAAHLTAVADAAAGATALFVGTVRDHDPDAEGRVVRLEYSAHPDAGRFLAALAADADAAGLRIAISHRVGALGVGETAIVCAVSSAHRADAFEVCRALVESVKAELPVWKKQVEADGGASWVGLGGLAT
ncbi:MULTISPECIES: molybdenum cofactor biosynthesis protein MoaE [Microbacterium]|uniref:molybdenum cofactor biosynthesis protein MoaE n=1 Tax=Microbacterium TaxID=33882 RepID=UPI00217D47E8|nr:MULTISPECIES: molybdenum cofactor biosynthesis protein MoaE [Microbacterium]UWF76995.1 molybdenum cofactor biosynthesis protein MoaE [Microbacterium neungamense]WCM55155.1 molybdenum cofactor biosynthesis protein MoaE [Microbacterium sp. EF45047]